jgi:hypothetical protein
MRQDPMRRSARQLLPHVLRVNGVCGLKSFGGWAVGCDGENQLADAKWRVECG